MARDKGGGTDFERDFGYLMPFLDKIQSAAQAATGPKREELVALVQGEKERWARIRALLAGSPLPPRGERPGVRGGVAPSGSAKDLTGRAAPSPRAEVERARTAFTVGSLRPQR